MVSYTRFLLYFAIVAVLDSTYKPFLFWCYGLIFNVYSVICILRIVYACCTRKGKDRSIAVQLIVIEGFVEYVKYYACTRYEIVSCTENPIRDFHNLYKKERKKKRTESRRYFRTTNYRYNNSYSTGGYSTGYVTSYSTGYGTSYSTSYSTRHSYSTRYSYSTRDNYYNYGIDDFGINYNHYNNYVNSYYNNGIDYNYSNDFDDHEAADKAENFTYLPIIREYLESERKFLSMRIPISVPSVIISYATFSFLSAIISPLSVISSTLSAIFSPLVSDIFSLVTSPISSIFAEIFSVFGSIFSFIFYYSKEALSSLVGAFSYLFETWIWFPITSFFSGVIDPILDFFYDLAFLLENIFIPILTCIILSEPIPSLEYISLIFELAIDYFKSFIYHGYYKFFGYGNCLECNLPFRDENLWCKPCNSKRFQNNFPNWNSGNETINNIIRNTQLNAKKACQVIEWVPYSDFINVEYVASGGFSKVYRAYWIRGQILSWDDHYIRNNNTLVALKELNNSSNISDDFLKELKFNIEFNDNPYTLKVIGISQNPYTKNYIIVTSYMKKGSLSTMLSKKKITNWLEKLYLIDRISQGIKLIHNAGYLHCDIHSGNIFYENTSEIYISDFGISMPASERSGDARPYGVLPYMAPEILNGGPRTKESDIYSLGILYWEIITQRMAYANRRDDGFGLILDVFEGLRPEFEERTPRYLKEEDMVDELYLKMKLETNEINDQSQVSFTTNKYDFIKTLTSSVTLIQSNINIGQFGKWCHRLHNLEVRWFPGRWTLKQRHNRSTFTAKVEGLPVSVTTDPLLTQDYDKRDSFFKDQGLKAYKFLKQGTDRVTLLGYFENYEDLKTVLESPFVYERTEFKWYRTSGCPPKKNSGKNSARSSQKRSKKDSGAEGSPQSSSKPGSSHSVKRNLPSKNKKQKTTNPTLDKADILKLVLALLN
ncbi:hypothetical protein RclHR1_04660009 [Rhizophagus clarus]|uniref:Protein kinase domain-containing protein n=1 Tax=Rhizophagus clarus TaxID=94130 RepID=A0A2Z6RIS0_9GLOM|nr:hypothetical protein RclHR1_04660009 [Rhizophagus clarus]